MGGQDRDFNGEAGSRTKDGRVQFWKCRIRSAYRKSSWKWVSNGSLHRNSELRGLGCICCCSVTQPCLTLCEPMDCSTPGFPVLLHLLEFAQTHVHWVSDAMQPFPPLSSSSAVNLSQHQGLFQWVIRIVTIKSRWWNLLTLLTLHLSAFHITDSNLSIATQRDVGIPILQMSKLSLREIK